MSQRFKWESAARKLWMAASLCLAACATPALPSRMAVRPGTVAPLETSESAYHRLRIADVRGGGGTNPLWMSNVASGDFRIALFSSLTTLGYLSDDPAQADLELTAELVALDRPIVALQPTVISKVHYVVRAVAGGTPIFDETLASSGTATMTESIFEPDPIRPANEAAIRANIALFAEEFHKALQAKAQARN